MIITVTDPATGATFSAPGLVTCAREVASGTYPATVRFENGRVTKGWLVVDFNEAKITTVRPFGAPEHAS